MMDVPHAREQMDSAVGVRYRLVNQKLLLQNEYLVAENRVLRAHLIASEVCREGGRGTASPDRFGYRSERPVCGRDSALADQGRAGPSRNVKCAILAHQKNALRLPLNRRFAAWMPAALIKPAIRGVCLRGLSCVNNPLSRPSRDSQRPNLEVSGSAFIRRLWGFIRQDLLIEFVGLIDFVGRDFFSHNLGVQFVDRLIEFQRSDKLAHICLES
jgi:hypothetical protein